jgi:tetratricopeptide (TPR) repeat protein
MAEKMLQTTSVSAPARGRSRAAILLGAAVILFLATYVLAWWDALRLTSSYIDDANRSYQEGRYLDALVGYETFDQEKREYVPRGGYLQIDRIWSNRYALPAPDEVRQAQDRIDDIIYSRLTLEDAEQFVQENIGRSNPAMGLIYLRLGELYEEAGELRDAREIYESIPDLFPHDAELIERARVDLERLLQEHPGA